MRKAYCEAEGIKAITARKDYALSRKTHHRPEFRRMIANALESDYVAICMFDRFSRDCYDLAEMRFALQAQKSANPKTGSHLTTLVSEAGFEPAHPLSGH